MPTDADRAALAEAKDICAERGWELHGWFLHQSLGWCRGAKPCLSQHGGKFTVEATAKEATDTDIDATIAVMARELKKRSPLTVVVYVQQTGGWVVSTMRAEVDGHTQEIRHFDSELAALVAVCKEVGK